VLVIRGFSTRSGGNFGLGNVLLTTRTIEAAAFGRKVRAWNSRELLMRWRMAWADAVNTALADAGQRERVHHRAGVGNHVGEPHLGGAATQMERRRIRTERGALRRTVKALRV
jgi:MobA/MobL family